MSRLKRFVLPVVVMMMMAVLVGCGRRMPVPQPVTSDFQDALKNAPRWVSTERDPEDKSNKNIYAVGSYGGTNDIGLARDGALESARARLAANLRTHVGALAEGYAANVQKTRGVDGVSNGASTNEVRIAKDDERKFQNGFENKVDGFVSGVEVVDTYADKSNRLYVLIRLNIDKFKETAQQMSELDADMKKAIDERAEAFWDKINNGKK